jgi:hypothetical protein
MPINLVHYSLWAIEIEPQSLNSEHIRLRDIACNYSPIPMFAISRERKTFFPALGAINS